MLLAEDVCASDSLTVDVAEVLTRMSWRATWLVCAYLRLDTQLARAYLEPETQAVT